MGKSGSFHTGILYSNESEHLTTHNDKDKSHTHHVSQRSQGYILSESTYIKTYKTGKMPTLLEVRVVVTPEGTVDEKEQESFVGVGNVLLLNLGSGYRGIFNSEHLSSCTHDTCTFSYVYYASIESWKENQLLCLIDDIRALALS